MSINFTEDQQRRLIRLYRVDPMKGITYDEIIDKYIFFLEDYLKSNPTDFSNPDYLYSFNGGFYFLLQNVLVDDKTEDVPIMEDVKNIAYKVQNGGYASLTHYEKLLHLLTQVQQRMNKMPFTVKGARANVSDMSYLVQCVYQTEKTMDASKQLS